jgi:hypothetical protein
MKRLYNLFMNNTVSNYVFLSQIGPFCLVKYLLKTELVELFYLYRWLSL